MYFVGILLREALRWYAKRSEQQDPYVAQLRWLRYLLVRAKDTQFGRAYGFSKLLGRLSDGSAAQGATEQLKEAQALFAAQIPVHSYEEIYEQWWKQLDSEVDVCWPGRVTRFALSSGTSMGHSKYIPVSGEALRQMRYVMMQQLSALLACDLPAHFYTGELLFLSGSTDLECRGNLRGGEISGMLAEQVPFWSFFHARSSARMVRIQDWEEKIDAIVRAADRMSVSAIIGAPIWVQLLLQRILDRYGLEHIHQIWPSLQLFVHGGVALPPYQASLAQLFGRDIYYLETYLASEGFIAYQSSPAHSSMQLSLEAGLFYEFVPYEGSYATSSDIGKRAVSISEIELHRSYELILSSCSGLWRYRIGDVVVFHSLDPLMISIEGRTQSYLNFCGEHLCLANLEAAIASASRNLHLPIKEFMVFGRKKDRGFEHLWYLGLEDVSVFSASSVAQQIDTYLRRANADYNLQRQLNLSPPQVELCSIGCFYDWMKKQGKWGKQHKAPRVLQGAQLQSWLAHLSLYSDQLYPQRV